MALKRACKKGAITYFFAAIFICTSSGPVHKHSTLSVEEMWFLLHNKKESSSSISKVRVVQLTAEPVVLIGNEGGAVTKKDSTLFSLDNKGNWEIDSRLTGKWSLYKVTQSQLFVYNVIWSQCFILSKMQAKFGAIFIYPIHLMAQLFVDFLSN